MLASSQKLRLLLVLVGWKSQRRKQILVHLLVKVMQHQRLLPLSQQKALHPNNHRQQWQLKMRPLMSKASLPWQLLPQRLLSVTLSWRNFSQRTLSLL